MKIYIVECGEYSDRTIEGIFSTREKAEEYIKYHKNDFYTWFSDSFTIGEWDLDSWSKEDYIYEYIVDIDENGELDEECIQTIEHNFSADINTNSSIYYHRFYCFSRNMLDIKEINDKYQKYRAEEMEI